MGEGQQREEKGAEWASGLGGALLAGVRHEGATQVETGKIPGCEGPCGRSSGEIGLGCGGGNMAPGASGSQWRY